MPFSDLSLASQIQFQVDIATGLSVFLTGIASLALLWRRHRVIQREELSRIRINKRVDFLEQARTDLRAAFERYKMAQIRRERSAAGGGVAASLTNLVTSMVRASAIDRTSATDQAVFDDLLELRKAVLSATRGALIYIDHDQVRFFTDAESRVVAAFRDWEATQETLRVAADPVRGPLERDGRLQANGVRWVAQQVLFLLELQLVELMFEPREAKRKIYSVHDAIAHERTAYANVEDPQKGTDIGRYTIDDLACVQVD